MNSNNVQNRQSIKILDDYVLSAKVQNGEMRTKYNALESLKLAPDKDTLENTIKRLEGEITALNEQCEILLQGIEKVNARVELFEEAFTILLGNIKESESV